MSRSPWHTCPQCGRQFAFYTSQQVKLLIGVGVVVAVFVNALLVWLLWNFA
jgi:hypothetical protein